MRRRDTVIIIIITIIIIIIITVIRNGSSKAPYPSNTGLNALYKQLNAPIDTMTSIKNMYIITNIPNKQNDDHHDAQSGTQWQQ